MNQSLTIVVPCYNAADILRETWPQFNAYAKAHSDVELVFVDDKSTDATAAILSDAIRRDWRDDRVRLIANATNLGKGGAVCHGLMVARTPWACFTDVDLAYDLGNITVLRQHLRRGQLVVACRVHPESRYLIRPHYFKYIATRHVMSRLFNRVVRSLLIPGVHDVQAGFKGGATVELQTCISRATKLRFSFDAELLFMASQRHLKIVEMPVTYRFDSPASTVHFASDGVRMLKDVLDIRWRGLRGEYR